MATKMKKYQNGGRTVNQVRTKGTDPLSYYSPAKKSGGGNLIPVTRVDPQAAKKAASNRRNAVQGQAKVFGIMLPNTPPTGPNKLTGNPKLKNGGAKRTTTIKGPKMQKGGGTGDRTRTLKEITVTAPKPKGKSKAKNSMTMKKSY